jgi:hypothetical protein
MHNIQTIDLIESYLNKCLNVENGRCNLTWKHDDCKVLMDILYDLTKDSKYEEVSWEFDQKQTSIWD